MENNLLTHFDSIFKFYNFYILLSFILFLLIWDKEKIAKHGGEIIYQKLDNTWMQFHIWGKDKILWEAMEGIRISILNAGRLSFMLLFVFVSIQFLNFLLVPTLMFFIFSIYFLYSYKWVLNQNQEFKTTFKKILKMIIRTVLIIYILFVIGITNMDLESLKDLFHNIPPNFKELIFIEVTKTSLIILIILSISIYLGMWILFGPLPIILILINYTIIKLSKNYTFFKSNIFKWIIYLNFYSIGILSLLKV